MTAVTTFPPVSGVNTDNYYDKTEVELLIASAGAGGTIDLSNYYKKLETYSKAQVDAMVSSGTTDLSNYYTRAQVDGLLGSISLDDYYDKTQTEVLLANKVEKEAGKGLSTNDFTNVFKQAYDGHLASASNPHSTTANQVGAYSKIEVDNLLANIDIDGALTDYYDKTETDSLLNTKQGTLVSGTSIKTINGQTVLGSGNIEITGGDVDLTNYYDKPQTETLLSNKVDKVTGKGLSTNDFTDTFK